MSNKPNEASTTQSTTIRMSVADDTAKNRLTSHVTEWWRRAVIIDKSLDRFTPDERQAYDYIRNVFDNPAPDMDMLQVHQQTIREVGMECHDEFGAAVKTFASKVSIITRDFDGFKQLLKEIINSNKSDENIAPTAKFNDGNDTEPTGKGHKRRMIQGATWEGEFNGETPVGSGKISFPDGSVYEGQWSKAGPHGNGVLRWANGEVWTAYFADGNPVRGKIQYANAVYEGELNENGPHGQGKTTYANRVDTGEYRHGERIGQGRIEWSDGDWYQGGWTEKGFHGFGTCYSAKNKRTDRGSYTDGQRTGEGRMDWENGSWYQGGWNDKGFHGAGTYYNSEAKRTDSGQYRDNLRIGQGRMEWNDGDWYQGEWNEDGRHGHGTYYNSTHKRKDIGSFENGRRKGRGRMEWESGDCYEGTWEEDSNGNLSGTGTYRYANGKTERGSYNKGTWTATSSTSVPAPRPQPKPEPKPRTITTAQSNDYSGFTVFRNILAWAATAVLIGLTIVALFDDGHWYEVLGTCLLTYIAVWIYAGDGDDREGIWNPATLMGATLTISGIIYFIGAIWFSYPWHWFIGGLFWAFVGFIMMITGTDEDAFD